jgi:iron complex outermembrane receptor protein
VNQSLLLSNIFYLNLFFFIAIQPLNAEEISPKILRLEDIKLPTTNVKDWLTQQSPTNEVIPITEINLKQTATGLEVILDSLTSKLSQPTTSSIGNTIVTEINNAILALPNKQEFRAENPAPDIALVVVTQINPNTVRIEVTGVDGIPTAQIIPSRNGLQVSVTPAFPEIEIIVTAQKKPEKLVDVPISLTVLSEQELEDARINSFRDIAANTPNFFTTVGDRAFNFQSIRGIGNGNFLVRDTIGFYIDDVPYENVHQFLPGALFDLERVEVLRGSQSTLYGRNSQAGVVNVISRPPSNSPEIRLGASYGNFNQRQVQLSLSDAVIPDKLAFRIGGIYDARDGFTEDTLLDEEANDFSSLAGRANILWTPTKNWSIAFNATGAGNQDGDSTFVPINQDDPFEVERNVAGETDLSVNTQSLKVAYENSGVKITSITTRNDTEHSYFTDGDYTSEDLIRFDVQQDSTVWSQEIRVQSPDTSDRFRWLVGGYYQNRNYDIDPQSSEYTAEGAALFDFPAIFTTVTTSAKFDQTTLAAFSQVDFQPIEPLTLTAGLRYENSQEDLSRRSIITTEEDDSAENTPFTDSSIDEEILIPKFALEYKFNPNISAYGSITRGYRPPSQNYQADDPTLVAVRAEKSWNYELGLKSAWLDNRLSLNFAAFINDISDYQIALTGDAGFFEEITNGKVEVTGFELEAKATPIEGLDFIAGFGYANAEYTDYTNPFTGENFNGNRLIYSPKYTYNLTLQYRSTWGLFSRVELQGLGKYFFNDANTLKQDAFALVNARVGYEAENYGIYFYVNNLFDEEYVTTAFVGAAPDPLAAYGDRRTFGIQVQTDF